MKIIPPCLSLFVFWQSSTWKEKKMYYILTKTAEHVISMQSNTLYTLFNPLTFINPFTTIVLNWLIVLLCFQKDKLYSSHKKLWMSDCSFMHHVFGYHPKQYHIKLLPFQCMFCVHHTPVCSVIQSHCIHSSDLEAHEGLFYFLVLL